MKHLKKIIACTAAVLTLTTAALAASAYETPAEAAAGVTGKSVEEVIEERLEGKSFGMIAAEAGVPEDFQKAVQALWEEALESRVAEGSLTRDQADARLDVLRRQQESCDGTGACAYGGQGGGMGAGFGGGMNRGFGTGRGCGYGRGLRDGSCLTR